ncbi:MAG: sulfite exporter TauE/SafE family protein [Rhodobacteraceae bacterium]|nr:sulfite exporter TauE/SafE family protein [Paracoccaceae bacterium]
MEGWDFWAVAVIASVLVGMSKGGLPGVGALAVPVLALVISPVLAAGLMLPVYVVSDWFGLYAYRREFDRRVLVIAMAGMTLGVGIGWATASRVSDDWVTALVGVISVAFALQQLLLRPALAAARRADAAAGMFWCTIAGFTSFVSHTGGPPYQVWTMPLGMKKAVFAGTATIAFAYVNAIKLVPYYFLGQINLHSLSVAAVLMPVAAAAVYGGYWLVRVLPEKLFFRVVTWSLLLIGLQLIWKGLGAVIAG